MRRSGTTEAYFHSVENFASQNDMLIIVFIGFLRISEHCFKIQQSDC